MKPILLATDGSPTATAATAKAIEFALALDAPVVVVTIWNLAIEPVGVGFGPVVPDLDRVGHERALEYAEGAAETIRAAGVEAEVVVRRGITAQEISALAEEHDAQLIVLGSHGWGAVRRAIFGSVSTSVLHHSHRPVLVVPAVVTAEEDAYVVRREKAEV
jgi:nucleotide-binding universal stress UspA family protein